MKRIQGNIIRDVICVVCVFAFAAYCSSQKWLLMFRGHQEMFLFDWGYIKDILGPISHVKLCATGGVTEENWGKYLEFGFAGAGISGRLCDKKCIAAGDFEEITRRAKVFMDITRAHA